MGSPKSYGGTRGLAIYGLRQCGGSAGKESCIAGYLAVIECEPVTSAEVENVALTVLKVPVPMRVAPSRNCDGTGWCSRAGHCCREGDGSVPPVDGFAEELTAVLVA